METSETWTVVQYEGPGDVLLDEPAVFTSYPHIALPGLEVTHWL
jgi:hypothetical protein